MSSRMERLNEQVQQEIALIIHRDVKDPRLGFVTITGTVLSRDLSHARVAYSCLGDEQERERSQEGLDNSAKYIRELLKKRLRLKTIPALTFHFDESIAHSVEMADVFERIRRQESGRQEE